MCTPPGSTRPCNGADGGWLAWRSQWSSNPPHPQGHKSALASFARGRIRRRIRFLRKARELAYRDLGGLVFNLHRFGQRNDALVLAKLTTLGHIDSELRALETTLHEPQPLTVLSEAGITACARCAAIHSSEDRFCPNCGLPLHRHADLPADLRTGATPPAPAQAGAPGSSPPSAFQRTLGAPVPPAQGPRTGWRLPDPDARHRHRDADAGAPATPSPAPATPAGGSPSPATPPAATPASGTPAGDAPAPAPPARGGQDDDEATAIVRPPANRQ